MSQSRTAVCAAFILAAMMIVAGVGCEAAEITVPIGERIDDDLSDWSGAWHHGGDVVHFHGGGEGKVRIATVLIDNDTDQFVLEQFTGFVAELAGTRYLHIELPEIDDIDETRYAFLRIHEVQENQMTFVGPKPTAFIAAVRAKELSGKILEARKQGRGHGVTRAIISDKAALDQFILESDRQLFNEDEPLHLHRVGVSQAGEEREGREDIALLRDRLRERHAEAALTEEERREIRRKEIEAMTDAELRQELMHISRLRRIQRGTDADDALREDFHLLLQQLRRRGY